MIAGVFIGLTVAVLGQTPSANHIGTLAGGLRSPARLAVGDDGTVYVTDPFLREVHRFGADGTPLSPRWSVPEGPIGIAVDTDGQFFVSLRDAPGVAVYDAAFTRTGLLGDANPLVAFVRPTDIDIAGDTGRIYVLDSGGDRVYGFEPDGTLALVFGSHGELHAQFQYPSALSVDEVGQRLVVADQDNFRIQVFSTSGLYLTRFGHRIKFTVGGGEEGWIVRPLGIEVDAAGRTYVADAMMNTVRVFDTGGRELSKIIDYNLGPNALRTACDLALSPDGSRLYVVSTNTSSVEVYASPEWTSGAVGVAEVFPIVETGSNDTAYDVARRLSSRVRGEKQWRDAPLRDVVDGGSGPDDGIAAPGAGYDGPHMIDATVVCGRCHDVDGQPGGHPGLLEGQVVLCASCHSGGGQAMMLPVYEIDAADPFGTNPAAVDGMGRSHAWGVAAVNALVDSVGPAPGSPMENYLDGGLIKCSTCHNQHNSDADPPYLRRHNDTDQMCKECHAPRNEGPGGRGTHPVGFAYPGGTGEFPPADSLGRVFIKNGNVECMTCHGIHGADSGGANGGFGDGNLLRAANDGSLCIECHANHTPHTTSGTWQPTCGDCHEPHDPSSENLALVATSVLNQTLGSPFPVVFTARSGANSFDDGDPAADDGICQVCHTQTRYHKHDGTGTAHNNGSTCTSCHTHDNGFIPEGGVSCIGCHSTPRDNGDGIPLGGRPAVVNVDGSGGHHLVDAVLSDDDCIVCHEMSGHQQGTVRLWLDPNDPVAPLPLTGDPSELVPFCSSCHDMMTHPVIHATPSTWDPVCTECHELHDPANANRALVRDVVRNETLGQDMPVVFTARVGPNSFDDGDPAANDGICQVCHTQTLHHRFDGSVPAHNDGTDCTGCHPHLDGFYPSAASCQDCHNVARGARRPVIGEFALASHHLQGPALDDADCLICHDMSRHQQGNVRLKNVDDPSNLSASIVLNGDPRTDPVEATKLEPFCLACHDGDAAGGAAPFSDGIVPAAIDQTLWNGASHRVAAMTCLGDGETFGCHATGHGSAKRMLLAPFDASQPPVAGDPLREEEGLCYSCHDTDGPAGTDVEAMFAGASHHNVSAAEQVDGSKVECTNCHNPHTASASAKLVNPDTGGVWTGTGPSFCLACHDGAPPVGVSFPPTAQGTGYDKSSFGGTTHSVRLGGNACRHCHEDHGSVYPSMMRGQYVMTDNNASEPGDGDYALCWKCHDETNITAADNAFNDLHEKHVGGEDAPCIICHNVHGGADFGEPGLIDLGYSAGAGYDVQFIDGRDASTAFWVDYAQNTGNCYLACHDQDHTPENYNRLPKPFVDCALCHTP